MTTLSPTINRRGVDAPPAAPAHRNRCAAGRGSGRPPGARPARGQSLVEFALILPVFVLLTVGMLDGTRVIFYYSQIQEAARAGARWGSVQVARALPLAAPSGAPQTPWGTFATPGNAPGVYCDGGPDTPCPTGTTPSPLVADASIVGATGGVTPTIVGAATHATTVNLAQATITISTTIPSTATETLQTDGDLTNVPVRVVVTYPFKPLLGLVFGGVTIHLTGTSTMLHE